jgi:hypothetical protein
MECLPYRPGAYDEGRIEFSVYDPEHELARWLNPGEKEWQQVRFYPESEDTAVKFDMRNHWYEDVRPVIPSWPVGRNLEMINKRLERNWNKLNKDGCDSYEIWEISLDILELL